MAEDDGKVAIHVQALGARRLDFRVEKRMEIAELRALIARSIGAATDRLKVMTMGQALRDQDGVLEMKEGAAYLAVMTKPGSTPTTEAADEAPASSKEDMADLPTF